MRRNWTKAIRCSAKNCGANLNVSSVSPLELSPDKRGRKSIEDLD
jgi:hypothetical protein